MSSLHIRWSDISLIPWFWCYIGINKATWPPAPPLRSPPRAAMMDWHLFRLVGSNIFLHFSELIYLAYIVRFSGFEKYFVAFEVFFLLQLSKCAESGVVFYVNKGQFVR